MTPRPPLRAAVLALALPLLGACIIDATTRPPANVDGTHYTLAYVTPANTTRELNHWVSLNADCTPNGTFTVRLIQPPAHGTALVQTGQFHVSYGTGNDRHACNMQTHPGIGITYTPAPNYVGPDLLTISVINPKGRTWTTDFHLSVR
jgi:hypothetical protein